MLKDYPQIIAGLSNSVWLMEQHSLAVILEIVNKKLNGEAFDEDEIRFRIDSLEKGDRENSRVEVAGGVGVLPIYGPMFPKANLMTQISGATSMEALSTDLNELMENPEVKTIILDIDSPGGAAEMIMEVGQQIKEASKPVYAVANTMAGSGAYWLGSQATKFYSTPSGKVGSIGVYTVHEDTSKHDESEGRKISFISAGKFKTAGNPHEPLSDEAKEYFQESVDELHEEFLQAVADGRGIDKETVRSSFGDGRMFNSRRAYELNMIDGINTLSDVIESQLEQNSPVIGTALTSAMARHHVKVQMLLMDREKEDRVGLLKDRAEHKEQEHSEPGTGTPPEPKPQEDPDQGGADTGSRRDTPPVGYESVAALYNVLQLGEEVQFTEVVERVKELQAKVVPIEEAEVRASERNKFEEAYPEEYDRLQKLQKKDNENAAQVFAGKYEVFKDKEGKETQLGFSARICEDIASLHMRFSDGDVAMSDVAKVLDGIAEGGLVEYGERGSSRGDTSTASNPRDAFAEKVTEIQNQDPELTYDAAVSLAAEQHPGLFDGYREAVAGRS